jgi:methyl-accepting chemotaxis protein
MEKIKKFFSKLGVAGQIFLWFLLISQVSIIIIAIISFSIGNSILKEQVFSKLQTLGILKQHQIQDYFKQKKADVNILSKNPLVIDALKKSGALYNEHDGSFSTFINTPEYKAVTSVIDGYFNNYRVQNAYYDIFLIDAKGNILYSIKHETDFGTNIYTGRYQSSSLAKAIQRSKEIKDVSLSDFEYYESSDKPASFLAKSVEDSNGVHLGFIAAQLPVEQIDKIMQETAGFIQTQKTFLVGEDYLLRSDISQATIGADILKKKVDTEFIRRAFGGSSHEEEDILLEHALKKHLAVTQDYRDVKVLTYYLPLGLKKLFNTDFDWIIVSEIDAKEAFSAISKLLSYVLIVIFAIVIFIIILSRYVAKTIADYIRRLIKNAIFQLDNVSSSLSTSSSKASAVSAKNAVFAQQLAIGSAKQFKQFENINKMLSEIASAVEQMSGNAQEISNTANNVSTITQEVGAANEKSQQGLKNIRTVFLDTTNMINELSNNSTQIKGIVESIAKLSEQTNLLALNATIEAARAGEAGLGFAVVADEVKKLAEQSSKSTEQINVLLTNIQGQIERVKSFVQSGNKTIDSGTQSITETLGGLNKIISSIQSLSSKIQELSAAVQQQSASTQEISKAMGSITEVTEQTADGAERLALAIDQHNVFNQQIADMAKQLQILAGDLKKFIGVQIMEESKREDELNKEREADEEAKLQLQDKKTFLKTKNLRKFFRTENTESRESQENTENQEKKDIK